MREAGSDSRLVLRLAFRRSATLLTQEIGNAFAVAAILVGLSMTSTLRIVTAIAGPEPVPFWIERMTAMTSEVLAKEEIDLLAADDDPGRVAAVRASDLETFRGSMAPFRVRNPALLDPQAIARRTCSGCSG